ncbi:MAG: transglutaminase domain-containing protein [Bacteroidales bacterium]|nr:transglutaminase domain-containing protein [Bacteroidales bacterium]
MKQTLLTFILLLTLSFAYSQFDPDKFREFANRQDSLFVKAYESRDIAKYHTLLDEFKIEYNKLSADDQKRSAGFLNGAYYNLCCTYALTGNKDLALKYLKLATEAGYIDYNHMLEDSDLNSLRKEKAYAEIVESVRKIGDYMYILKNDRGYNKEEKREIPPFTYQSSEQPELVALRKAFNLDSVAGKGTDVFQILNMLHWMHYMVPHDGNHDNPVVKNAMNMISICKRDHRGLNCRGLATVLNECYLSMGFKSRIVTCYPKDSLKIDPDCHVINMVWAESMQKWLWIDPTNDAYVINEKGEILSIEEVRARIISDQPLILNPEANWNRYSTTKEFYLYQYMAKNLYMMESPVSSEYDMETRKEGKTYIYTRLVPLDYSKQLPIVEEEKNQETKTTWIEYRTNNPAVFWQKP